MKPKQPRLSVGDWVEVRTKHEILRTLDSEGRLDGMPFMPEMFAFCGRSFQVYKRAHKTCDTVFPVRGRRVDQAVHLETRCDGSAHGGCEARCLIFWKEAWLRPISSPHDPLRADHGSQVPSSVQATSRCTETDVLAHALTPGAANEDPTYVCQATRLPYATKPLEWWDIRQYFEDFSSGNVSLWRIICGLVYSLYNHLTRVGIGGPTMRRIYDKFHFLWGGTPFPRKTGTIPEGQPTPNSTLDLQPGELVRIKSHDEILKTLNTSSRNRGLYWDAEEVPYCGGTYRVLQRVTKIINEKTGKMRVMKTPCVILDSVVCQSRYSECRMFCPRSIYPYWREIWLERVRPTIPEVEYSDLRCKN
jgi:hypothetical protein